MDSLTIALIGLAGMFALIALHVPIGVAMGLSGVASVAMMLGWDPALSLVKTEASAVFSHRDLGVIPLFLMMGSFATAAGLSTDLYRLAYALVGHYRGGLAMSTIGGCAGFGAICGSSVATAATMGRVALPEMLRRGYQPSIATGAIAAGGTLGILIPPSVIMVLYAVLTEQFIISLFVAAIIPAIIAVTLHLVAVIVYVRLNPEAGPAGPRMPWSEKWAALRGAWQVLVLIVIVSGGIYGGVFTAVEAASVGVCLAFIFTVLRGRLTWKVMRTVLGETAASTGLIYLIIVGANVFTYFVTLSHMADDMVAYVQSLGLHPLVVIFMLHAMYLVLGSIFDTVAAMVITLPFVFPLIIGMGMDPLWFGIINVMVIEIGLITPPIGINVFVLHGIAKSIPLQTIFRGIMPFLAADLIRLSILTVFPVLALWLPTVMGMPM
ncbi:MAG: TRAP transporter large permease [Rhodospirillales bacterium]